MWSCLYWFLEWSEVFKKASRYSQCAVCSLGGIRTHSGHESLCEFLNIFKSPEDIHVHIFSQYCQREQVSLNLISRKVLDTHFPLKPGSLNTFHNEVLSLVFCHLNQIKFSCTFNVFLYMSNTKRES